MDSQRYPISVRLLGVMHKEKKKLYMVSVLWSDQNDIVVYRTFRDFQEFHKQMKAAFPAASKMKKSTRVIPKFHHKRVRHRDQKKTPTKSLVRLKLLQKYCTELLSCEPRVCQCTDLIQFFHPNEQDLQPEFSNNSIMIMPSNDELKDNFSGGNVTKPFVTETYCCVAAYETKDTKNKPFKVAAEEKVDVLIKDKGGWWLVENDEKRMAWFPAPYLEKLEDDNGDEIEEPTERGTLYTAIKKYKATKDDEISVVMGAVVEILQKTDNGWWLVRYKETAGYIPSVYLRSHNNPHMCLTPRLPERRSSLEIPSLARQSQFSRSQANLLEMPSSRPSSPHLLKPESKQKSQSLNVLPARSQTRLAAVPTSNVNVTNGTALRHPPPTITVEMDDNDDNDDEGRSVADYRRGSFDSEIDFCFSDDLSYSSGGSSLNLSAAEDGPRFALPPPRNHQLSPSAGAGMTPSVSDPSLFKCPPASPKVPPRPKPQQILTRCTTITRKNAAKGSNTQTGIVSS
ncbi:NADPH oxidase organizer 1a [Eucyclogobius newberryi]|uniref:NADPH oxidase organizer 1a n=1 Tax=Eucyclogobius newberryi TaxID=166745 RepID=UPI003B5C63C5